MVMKSFEYARVAAESARVTRLCPIAKDEKLMTIIKAILSLVLQNIG